MMKLCKHLFATFLWRSWIYCTSVGILLSLAQLGLRGHSIILIIQSIESVYNSSHKLFLMNYSHLLLLHRRLPCRFLRRHFPWWRHARHLTPRRRNYILKINTLLQPFLIRIPSLIIYISLFINLFDHIIHFIEFSVCGLLKGH